MDKDISFKDFSEIWFAKHTVGVSYSYKKSIKNSINHCVQSFGFKKISDVQPGDIDDLICKLAEENPHTHKPTSKKTLQQLVNISYNIFEYALENDLIIKNPSRNKKKKIPKNAPQKVVKAINYEQYELVLKVEQRLKLGAMLMMFSGIRRGELIALEWSDVHIEDYYNRKGIDINKSASINNTNSFIVHSGTKNGKSRFVPIPEFLHAYLLEEKQNAISYLVCPQDNGKIQTPSTWSRYWKTYQADLNYHAFSERFKRRNPDKAIPSKFSPNGIPKVITEFNAHQLRHMYATLLFLSGIDALTASQLMGHSSVEITLDIYTHLEEQYRQIDVSKLDKFIKYDINKLKE